MIADTKRKIVAEFKMKDLGYDALFSRDGGVADYRWNLPWTREVCSRDPEDIWDDGMQGINHTYGIKPKAIE